MANNKRNAQLPDMLLKAKELYLSGQSVVSISKDLDIPRSTLNYHIKSVWKDEKSLRGTELLATVSDLHITTIQSMTKHLLIAARRAAEDLATRNLPPTSKEMVNCANVIEKLSMISERIKAEESAEREKNKNTRDVAAIDPFGGN